MLHYSKQTKERKGGEVMAAGKAAGTKKVRIGRAVLCVILALLLAVAVYLLCHREMARVFWVNWTAPALELENGPWENGASYEKAVYASDSDAQYLDLYVPDSTEPMPLLVLIHGGGFCFNDSQSREVQFMYRYFRDQGFACASINYRLTPEAGFPAAVEDVKAAIRFLKANAGQYGYDAERVAVFGESAGGYLAVMAAVTGDGDFQGVEFIGESQLDEKISGKVDVLVDFYGIIDLEREETDLVEHGIPAWSLHLANAGFTGLAREAGFTDLSSYWLQKQMEEMTAEELARTNPHTYIDQNLDGSSPLQVIIRHGDADLMVSRSNSLRLEEHLRETLGEDQVSLQIYHNFKHADDRFYTDEELDRLCGELHHLLGE